MVGYAPISGCILLTQFLGIAPGPSRISGDLKASRVETHGAYFKLAR